MIFGSDNQAGASERVLDAISDAYRSHHDAYGADAITAAAVDALRETFDTDLTACFVSSGTAANMLALSTMVQPWDGVVCHHQAHILLDESTGPSLFTGGASMLPVPDRDLRLDPGRLATMLDRLPSDGPHNVRPRALSITQANECGQIHTVDEVAALSAVARDRNLRVHMDGARFANAVAKLGVHPGDVTWRAGVDVLCLGASKNGAVAAEAIVFFDRELAVDVEYRLKRTGHLTSKARLYGAQFLAWLADDHWLDLARTANRHADRLRAALVGLEGVRLAWPSESNESFVVLDRSVHDALMAAGASMYEWYPNALPEGEHLAEGEVLARLVTSFATTDAHVDEFVAAVRAPSRS
ncbi:MAG: beta-eliminating lyase-related protein [Ilumatobacteraceae bacterium]|nr:beta-eliminating lyase-related protein [Ilumatobacteraceae bacterium]